MVKALNVNTFYLGESGYEYIKLPKIHLAYLHSDTQGAPNRSVPQNICSSGKFLLAGRFGKNDMSLEGTC